MHSLEYYVSFLSQPTIETLIMVFVSTACAYLIGIVLGVILYLTAPQGLTPNRAIHAPLGWIVNIARSLPFVILLISMIPVTRALVQTSTGIVGVIPPLVASAAPFVARMIEQSLNEVSRDTIEAAQAFGASTLRIVISALLPEALPSIVRGMSISLIAVLGYTAIAGVTGAGGLGDTAIRYGYYRYEDDIMFATVIVLVVIVQLIQTICDRIARAIDHR